MTVELIAYTQIPGKTGNPLAVVDFMRLTLNGGRRSIPPVGCAEHGVLVGQRQLRVNWRYDVAGMMERMVKNCDISRVSCQEDRHCAASGN